MTNEISCEIKNVYNKILEKPMKRTYLPFDDTWRMRINIPVSKAVRCGNLVFLCGQCDLDPNANPPHPNDLHTQTQHSLDRVFNVLGQMNAEPADTIHLHVFYCNNGAIDEKKYGIFLSNLLPDGCNPVIVFTPVSHFFYPGLMVEIDAIAAVATERASSNQVTSCIRKRPSTIEGLRSGKLVFIKAQPPFSATGSVENSDDIQRQTEAVMNGIASELRAC